MTLNLNEVVAFSGESATRLSPYAYGFDSATRLGQALPRILSVPASIREWTALMPGFWALSALLLVPKLLFGNAFS